MKEQLYKQMEVMFPLIAHNYREVGAVELLMVQLARGNTFNTRVVGLEEVKRFRKANPDCALTFKPNHLSEADFLMLSLLFRENGLRVLIEGGANLFIDDIDLYHDILTPLINPDLKSAFKDHHISLAEYLTRGGSFKVFRNPVNLTQADGTEVNLGKKEILMLSRAYREHLVASKEMFVTFPGFSTVKSGLFDFLKKDEVKTGRTYTGKIDGFHHLPFQMEIEAAANTGTDIYVVDVNIAYEPVLEDMNFMNLRRMQEGGADPNEIYQQDLGFIIREFMRSKRKGHLSIKFSPPRELKAESFKEGSASLKIKRAAQKQARLSFENVLEMQPVFPANLFFSAFNKHFDRIPIPLFLEKIDDLRIYLRGLMWGNHGRPVDMHYVMDYRGNIISADEIINRTFFLFNTEHRKITDCDGDMMVVYNKDVASQYRNHTTHFFEPFFDKQTKNKD